MMVHASISSTQVYAQVTDSKISEDMDRLIDKYKAKDKNTANADMEATIGTKTISFVINSNERKTEAYLSGIAEYCIRNNTDIFVWQYR